MRGLFARLKAALSAERVSFVAVGYPKVGNTWLRLTLGRYIQQLARLDELPLLEPGDSARLSKAIGSAAVGYSTHAPLEWATQTANDLDYKNVVEPFRKLKVILLVRHPLDALASFHKHQLHRDKLNKFEGDLAHFIESPVFGLEKFIRFYDLWQKGRAADRVLLWRYEDARSDMVSSLRRILEFLGLALNDEMIANAVDYGSFENMKALERSRAPLKYRSSGFQIFATGDVSNPDAFHVRKGEVGGFRNELRPEDAERFELIVRNNMPSQYGYC